MQPLAFVRLKTEAAQDTTQELAVDTFLLSSGAPVSVADVLARYGRPLPAPGEPLLKPPGGAGGGQDRGGGTENPPAARGSGTALFTGAAGTAGGSGTAPDQ